MTTNFRVLCPTCGSVLSIKHDRSSSEPQPEDRLVCPTHGDVGSYAEFEPGIRDAVIKQARDMLDKALKGR